uniref:DDE_3 domain-containing protein n=1 Tax=Heterorhabditis bacteriophora TaxID=37862 RepID=A0A1I7WYQ1_HETBA
MEWPSQSPDLNPIEHLWNDVEKEAVIKKAWAQISVQRCAKLVDSMPRRCATVIKNFGYPTKYQLCINLLLLLIKSCFHQVVVISDILEEYADDGEVFNFI